MKMHLEDIDKIRLAVSKQILQARKSKLGQFMTPAPIAHFMASIFDQQGGENAVNNIQFQTGGGFTHAILNPPYKKISNSSRFRRHRRRISGLSKTR
jgi:hypothetical protein